MTKLWRICAAGLLAGAAVGQPVHAQEPADASQPSDPFAPMQAFLDEAVESNRIPGGLAMIALNGEILWQGAAGEMGPDVPMRADAIMPLASVGKLYTATAVMILVERGAISLDDPVSRFLPAFADVQIAVENADGSETLQPPDRAVTIRDLLTHTSGLHVAGDGYWPIWNAHAGVTTTTEFANALAALPMNHQPGTHFEYGFTGGAYEVLGAVIETVTGQTLEAFMDEAIFAPLGLEESHFFLPDEQLDRYPAFFHRDGNELVLDRAYAVPEPRNAYFFGGGGVEASAHDIARFARTFTEAGFGDENRIISVETARLMMRDHIGDLTTFSNGLSWGFGSAVRYGPDGDRSGLPDQFGWVGGGYAKLIIAPRQGLTAYIAFPIRPPGDNDLLNAFDQVLGETVGRMQAAQQ